MLRLGCFLVLFVFFCCFLCSRSNQRCTLLAWPKLQHVNAVLNWNNSRGCQFVKHIHAQIPGIPGDFPSSNSLYSIDLLSIDSLSDLHVKAVKKIYILCFPMPTYSNCWRLEVFLIPVTSLYLGILQDERLQVFHPQGFSLWLPDRQQAVLTLTGWSIDTEVDLTE